jgi:hypothetical protein
MIVSTSGRAPAGLSDLICAGRSFDDVPAHLLPALADDLDAESASFRHVIREGGTVRLGQSTAHRVRPANHDTWRQQFRRLDPVAVAAPIPARRSHSTSGSTSPRTFVRRPTKGSTARWVSTTC